MPSTPILTVPEGQRASLVRLLDVAPEVQGSLGEISQRAENDLLLAYLDGYRNRLNELLKDTALLLGWIGSERPAPVPEAVEAVPKKPELDPAIASRAKIAQKRLKERHQVAELRATIQEMDDAGFAADASERDLERIRDAHMRHSEDNYVFGLARGHRLSTSEWKALADAYRVLANEAQGWTRRTAPIEAKDAERIAELKARFDAAIAPIGHHLNHDVDVDWLATFQPAPTPARPEPALDDLATFESMQRMFGAAGPARAVAPTAAFGPTGADRSRLKADVARVKGRLARAESRGQRDEDAILGLARLQTRHRVEFHQDGYVFGFSAAHQLEPDAWEDLARAYENLADALERGVASDADALAAQAALDGLNAAIAPIGRALRHDDDADDLQEELRDWQPRRAEAADPLAAFLPLPVPDDAPAATDLAVRILVAGVRPSDPRLREPFIEWTDDLDDPSLRPLVAELRREMVRRQAQEDEAEPIEPDPAYLDLREKVRAITRGKRVLMVGGGNREETRRAIEAELEAQVSWPDSDEHMTKPGDFDPHVDRADMVIKNRFCRRGYQRAFERAKGDGKPAVALTAGYNPRQVVRGIAEALRL